ncbi:MAG: hypothetical protein IJC82_05275, partial [Firmicutes bacterium]|nr:hypothetical protein [Bacillota bacterium]
MKKSMMILICVLLCMFAFTAGVSAESILPDVLPESNIEGIQLFADTAGTEVNVDNNVIDIMDKDIYSYSSYKGTATTITITGANVVKATESNTDIYIVLASNTSTDAAINATFGYTLSNKYVVNVSQSSGEVQLGNGIGTATVTLTCKVMNKTGSISYNLHFSTEEPPTELPTCIKATDSKELVQYSTCEIDLSEYFKNAETYYLVENGVESKLGDKIYSRMFTEVGEYSLTFAAANAVGKCADTVNVTVNVKENKSVATLGMEYSNGSFDRVLFADGNGKWIEGMEASFSESDRKISVVLPKTYPLDGTVKAIFHLTQNESGYPLITTKTGTSGTTAGRYDSNKFTEKTTALSSGAATFTFYLYDVKPSAAQNTYYTYQIIYELENEVPTLKDGQADSAEETITVDDTYSVPLASLFTDAEGDSLTYQMQVNNGAAETVTPDADGNYVFSTTQAGSYTLVFTANDGKATSTDTYTVNLTVNNSNTENNMTFSVPEDLSPVFYMDAALTEELTATTGTADNGMVPYTVTYPVNAETIYFCAENWGGMSVATKDSEGNAVSEPIVLRKFNGSISENDGEAFTADVAQFTVMYGEQAAVSGGAEAKENGSVVYRFLLVADDAVSYTYKAATIGTLAGQYADEVLESQTLSAGADAAEQNFVLYYTNIYEVTVPADANVAAYNGFDKSSGLGAALALYRTVENDDNTVSWQFRKASRDYMIYRVSGEDYVTYAGTLLFSNGKIAVTEELLTPENKTKTSLDRDLQSQQGCNVADVYLNVNAAGYLELEENGTFDLDPTRRWWGNSVTWSMDGGVLIEPDSHYTIVDKNGEVSNDIIEIDADGKITAKSNGTAIVLVTYDAMTLNFADKHKNSADRYEPNGFYGALWPENTGVFVVSVGAEDSGISTGMTINEDKTSTKLCGSAIDSEFDVIYFIGDEGEYTFTPETEGVAVSVANPVFGEDGTLGFAGFESVAANADGSYSVPLTHGRNVVCLEKDGKAEYQVITAKEVDVTVNGVDLAEAKVTPGEKVKIVFDTIYTPVTRTGVYNSSTAVAYHSVSGYEGKLAGNACGSMGTYQYASRADAQTVEHIVKLTSDSSGWSNPYMTTVSELVVPEDYTEENFVLSDGVFQIVGFGLGLGSHRNPVSTGGDAPNLNSRIGSLPDISIPVDIPEYITVYASFMDENGVVVGDDAEQTELYDVPLKVYDLNEDGKYTLGEGFTALHEAYCAAGAEGFTFDAAGGWVSQFWGGT